MDYKLSIRKGGKAHISASPNDYAGGLNARGSCIEKEIDPEFVRKMEALDKQRAKGS